MAQDYARAVAKIVTAQIAESVGFEAIQQSARDTLADLLVQYIAEIGASTHAYAELAGRTDCNVNDLLLALEDVGASAEEIIEYGETMEDIPFAHSVPSFPVTRKAASFESFDTKKEEPPSHIPKFLPAFPEKHTYMDTPVFTGHSKDARQQKLAQGKARQEAEKALLKLAARSQPKAEEKQGKDGSRQAGNLFLASPQREAEDTGDAMPMEVDERAPHVPLGSWEKAGEAAPPLNPQALLQAPLKLDWTQPSHVLPLRDAIDMGFEDAFANATEEVVDTGGRRRRLSMKAKSAGDPSAQRAEQILAAGASAMNLEEAAPERSGK